MTFRKKQKKDIQDARDALENCNNCQNKNLLENNLQELIHKEEVFRKLIINNTKATRANPLWISILDIEILPDDVEKLTQECRESYREYTRCTNKYSHIDATYKCSPLLDIYKACSSGDMEKYVLLKKQLKISNSEMKQIKRVEEYSSSYSEYYSNASDDFFPKLPDPDVINKIDKPYAIYVDRNKIGMLTQSFVYNFNYIFYDLSSLNDHDRKIADEDISILNKNQKLYKLLKCSYISENKSSLKEVVYWYEKTPSIAEKNRLKSRLPNHPLLRTKDPITQCPNYSAYPAEQFDINWKW